MTDVIERLRQWIDHATKELENFGVDYFNGADWYQLEPEESYIFELKPEAMPRVVVAYDACKAIAALAHNDLYGTPLCDEARKALDWIRQGELDCNDFMRFAKMFGVSNRIAHAFFQKMEFWYVRSGVTYYSDEDKYMI